MLLTNSLCLVCMIKPTTVYCNTYSASARRRGGGRFNSWPKLRHS